MSSIGGGGGGGVKVEWPIICFGVTHAQYDAFAWKNKLCNIYQSGIFEYHLVPIALNQIVTQFRLCVIIRHLEVILKIAHT